MAIEDKGSPKYWKSVKPGDIVGLTDEGTLTKKMALKKGIHPEEALVESVSNLVIQNDREQTMAEYIFLKLAKGDIYPNGVSLHIKIIDNAIGVSIRTPAEDWAPKTRENLLQQDCTFLWEAPQGEWSMKDLRYIADINHDATGVKYKMKPQGELTGKMTVNPPPSGIQNLVGTIVEYIADNDCENTELIVLEIGEGDSGLITLELGRPLLAGDVSILKRS